MAHAAGNRLLSRDVVRCSMQDVSQARPEGLFDRLEMAEIVGNAPTPLRCARFADKAITLWPALLRLLRAGRALKEDCCSADKVARGPEYQCCLCDDYAAALKALEEAV